MNPTPPQPVKFFIGILYSDEARFQRALEACTELLGSIDYTSNDFLFDITDYYNQEMDTPIYRQFISFAALYNPSALARLKINTNNIEQQVADRDKRKVNLDIGYMDYHKIVLASAKYNSQKIYLDHGIYADPTMYYRKGKFHPYEWAFPDFKDSERYYDSFLEMRQLYKEQLRNQSFS